MQGSSPTGRLAVQTGTEERSWLEVSSLDGTGRVMLTQPDSRSVVSYGWSPDGTRLLVLDVGPGVRARGKTTLGVVNADGSGSHPLARWPQFGRGIGMGVWAPDGNRVAFSQQLSYTDLAKKAGWPALFVVNADGTDLHGLPAATPKRRSTVERPTFVDPVGWSVDGSTLFYTVSRYSRGVRVNDWVSTVLYAIGPDGAPRRRVAKLPNIGWLVASPDATMFAFVTGAAVDLVDAATGSVRPLLTEPQCCDDDGHEEVTDLVWMPGRPKIVYTADRYTSEGELLTPVIRAIDVDTGAVQTLVDVADESEYGLTAARDGGSFAYLTFASSGPPNFEIESEALHVAGIDGSELANYPLEAVLNVSIYLN